MVRNFIEDYFSKSAEILTLYHYKTLPTGKEIADELQRTGQLSRAIDQNTVHYEVAYLLKEFDHFSVFTFYKGSRLNDKQFNDLYDAVVEKFDRIVMGIWNCNR